ncbi:hypothetical protein [Neorhizobium petrolearium]|uniref:Growth inhibitor PemK n=1 Tax=Neorhizobium petrolearium TaxID=515361 RepID=A0ABY8M503_9HYPH|nr:hypothetical protein [Neorhizobium petrolearium]MCC2608832.1 hypothetical protein [Neorhizobium petrolearium]WGI69081.1 hypothetical protein QEO92_03035 [Neorhizobium petrolearium]
MKIPRSAPVGSVIAYEYLWHSQSGIRDDGEKARPAVIILSVTHEDGKQIVYCLGISHSEPRSAQRALPMPIKLLRHLGLSDAPSWVYTDQLNVFVWPSPDLRPASWLSSRPDAEDSCVIGVLPGDWFEMLKAHLEESHKLGRLALIKRDG